MYQKNPEPQTLGPKAYCLLYPERTGKLRKEVPREEVRREEALVEAAAGLLPACAQVPKVGLSGRDEGSGFRVRGFRRVGSLGSLGFRVRGFRKFRV